MTTIVVDVANRAMAADKQATDASGYKYETMEKIRRFKKDGVEVLVGGAGGLRELVQFFDWFESGGFSKKVTEKTKREYPKLEALALFSTGELYEYDGSNVALLVGKVPFHGIGSGSGYALGALYAGADVSKAVQIASMLDTNTGFKIQVERLTSDEGH